MPFSVKWPRVGRKIMEERKKGSVDDWIARRQHLRHIAGYQERKEVILLWVPAVVVVCAIMAVMIIFGEG